MGHLHEAATRAAREGAAANVRGQAHDATAEESDASDEEDEECKACGQLSAWCVCGQELEYGCSFSVNDHELCEDERESESESESESECESECERQSVSSSQSDGSRGF